MSRKKPPGRFTNKGLPCLQCEYLERQYQAAVAHIREVLGTRFQSRRDKIRELQKWQENRDDAIEELYAHKGTHRQSPRGAPGQNAA